MNSIFDQSLIPRYIQLAELFRQRIAKGVWPAGHRLPSLDELADEFGVARVTVRQAMKLLNSEGLVSPRQGKGTFTTGKGVPDRWLRLHTTLDELAVVYRDTEPHILNIVESNAAPTLGEADGKPAPEYFYMRRLHLLDGKPYVVIGIYLDSRIFNRSPEKFRKHTVIPLLLDSPGVTVEKARQTLTIGSADMEIGKLLAIPVNAPVAEVRRVFNETDNTVIYLAEAIYRGDFIHLDMNLYSKEGKNPPREK